MPPYCKRTDLTAYGLIMFYVKLIWGQNKQNMLFVDWTGADEDEGDVNVWEDNWDDDNIEDDFSQQLR